MAFVVVYDANVLYPNTLRDLLTVPEVLAELEKNGLYESTACLRS